jgi:transposase
LETASRGRVTKHHRFLLKLHLDHIDPLDAAVRTIDEEVSANVQPFRAAIELLSTIPGISHLSIPRQSRGPYCVSRSKRLERGR